MKINPRRVPVTLAATLLLVLALISPHQLPIVLYKLAMILTAAVAGYLIDWAIFFYSQPSGYLREDWRKWVKAQGWAAFLAHKANFLPGDSTLFLWAASRRAALIVGAMLAVGLGL